MNGTCAQVLMLIWLVAGFYESTILAQEPPGRVAIQVRETAGIRRFGYPVTAQVPLPLGALEDTRHVRLVNAEGKPISAQITAAGKHADGSLQRIELDFNLSPAPLETTKLIVEYGSAITANEPKQGLSFTETADTYQVSAYTIRKDAQPLISNVRYGREYLTSGGLGVIAWSDGADRPLRAQNLKWSVEKRGPFQARLRCDGVYAVPDGTPELPFTLTLEFVSSKSWVGLHHVIHPAPASKLHVASGVAGDFQLVGRLLWDTDVGYWLYGVLEQSEQMVFFQSKEAWQCQLGTTTKATPYAVSIAPNSRSKGWGHFQEARENGNVVAFGFGGATALGDYSWTLSADGKLRLKGNPSDSQPAQLSAFFHFIPVPTQHTARTSPAAMMSPLEVTYPVE